MIELAITGASTKQWFWITHLPVTDHGGNPDWKQIYELHRINGPAIQWADGDQDWYKLGKRHRTNGPAVTRIGRKPQYWVNGKQVTEFEAIFLDNQDAV